MSIDAGKSASLFCRYSTIGPGIIDTAGQGWSLSKTGKNSISSVCLFVPAVFNKARLKIGNLRVSCLQTVLKVTSAVNLDSPVSLCDSLILDS